MDKKIASEFALGVVIFLAVVVGGIFFLQSQQNDSSANIVTTPIASAPTTPVATPQPNGDVCKPHYYEGEQQVHVWPVADASSDNADGLVVNINPEDAKTLPAKQVSENGNVSNFTVKLVDASSAISKKIEGATQEEPAIISIKGYAEVCTQPPLVSLQPASEAFKKG